MQDAIAKNQVKRDPQGYIVVTLVGDQNEKTIEDSAGMCRKFAGEMAAEKKPLLGLIDFTSEKRFSTGANKATLAAMGGINYDRVALFGTSPVLTEVTKLIIQALGKGERTKVFATREEAVAWLMMHDPVHGYGEH